MASGASSTWSLLQHEWQEKITRNHPEGTKITSTKDMAEAHRNMDTKERGMNTWEILGHDVLPASPLFDGDLVRLSLDSTSPNGVQSLLLPLMLW